MIRQFLLYLLVRSGNGALSIATLVIFTRILSAQEYGIYALGMATATMASAVLYQWLNVAVGRFYPMHRDKPEIIMASASVGFWAATAVCGLLFLVAFPFHERLGIKPALFALLALVTIMLGRHTLALQVANSQQATLRFGLLSWARSGIGLLIGSVLIYYGFGAQGALLGFLGGLVMAVLFFGTRPRLGLRWKSGDGVESSTMLRYGLPLSLNFFAIVIVDMADRFMIGWLLGPDQVAPYAVAYEFIQQSIGPIMNVLFLAAFPMLVHALESAGDDAARVRLQALGCSLVAIGLPAVAGVAVLSHELSAVVFGSGFRQEASQLMPWIAAAIFVGCFKTYFLDSVFQLRNVTRFQGIIAIVMAVTNVLMNWALLPRYGVIAAAWSTFAAFSVGLVLSWHVGKPLFALPSIGKDVVTAGLASAGMALALYLLPPGEGVVLLVAKIITGVLLYAVLAWCMNVAQFRRHLSAILSRRLSVRRKD